MFTVNGKIACNECFCFGKVKEADSNYCHNYDADLQKFFYGNEVCSALQPGDSCYPKIFTTLAGCESACKRFYAMAKIWRNLPMID